MKVLLKRFNPASIAAIVALLAVFVYDVFAPRASLATTGKKVPVARIAREGAEARARLDDEQKSLRGRTFTGAEDEVVAKVMATTNGSAKKNGVTISAFRPQRTASLEGLTLLNYLVAAEGSYTEVVRFLKTFEGAGSKIAVKSVQMTSADGATDQVRASIGLVAYLQEEKKKNGK